MIRWFRRLGCPHGVWDYHVRGFPASGEPASWKVCRLCGKRVIESWEK